MRKDVQQALEKYSKKDLSLLNKSELARQLNCNRRTLDRYIAEKLQGKTEKKKRTYNTLLDNYKEKITSVLNTEKITAMDIYDIIQEKGYTGGYETVAKFVKEYKKSKIESATKQFQENPGMKARVIWNFSAQVTSKSGKKYNVRIFLMVLGYSGKSYIKLTSGYSRQTLVDCLLDAFNYYDGIPHQLLFDDRNLFISRYKLRHNAVFNPVLVNLAKKKGFALALCHPFCPDLKKHTESVSRLSSTLASCNNNFNSLDELEAITNNFLENLNREELRGSQSPNTLFLYEKDYLMPLL